MDITIQRQDGQILQGTLFRPDTAVRAAVMIAPATGIKRGFYASFANYLSERGFGILTFDNTGIGDSLQGSIKTEKTSLQDWGQKDMPAVLTALQEQFPRTTYHLIGHSAGGQLVGLMPNAMELSSLLTYASSSGQIQNMKFSFYPKARFYMDLFIPLNNFLFGYTNSQWIGMGEPLPKRVAAQWRKWCNGQGYAKTAFDKTIHEHWYHQLDCPSFWINATDDPIAVDENVEDMLTVFTKLPAERLKLDPCDYDLPEIGHMKFFSRKNQVLWTLALDWLNKHSTIPPNR